LRQVIGVRSLEVFYFAILEMPDASGNFLHHVVIVGDQQDGPIVFLKGNVQGVNRLQI